MRQSLVHILAVLALVTGIVACNDDSCYDNVSSLPLATLYLGNAQQSIAGLTIMGIGAPGDSLLVDSSTVNEVYLPLRASVGSTTYALRRWVTVNTVNTRLCDTISLNYDAIEFFHSIECGTMYNFDIKSITHTTNGIDSVVLLNRLVTNSKTPVMRIHFTDFH